MLRSETQEVVEDGEKKRVEEGYKCSGTSFEALVVDVTPTFKRSWMLKLVSRIKRQHYILSPPEQADDEL